MSEGSAPQVEQGRAQPQAVAAGHAPGSAPLAARIPSSPTALAARSSSTGGWWTLPLLSLGLAMIASALIVGQVEENRELAWQKNKLQMDLDYLEKQASVNEEFLTKLKQGEDAGLVERLAQRQKNLVRKGSAILDLKGPAGEDNTSAFKLTRLPPPPEIRPYEPARGFFTRFLGSAHQRVMAYGIGGFLVALGLISGGSEERKSA